MITQNASLPIPGGEYLIGIRAGAARILRSLFRRMPVLGYVAFSGSISASGPAFLFEPLYASNSGAVYGVFETRQADLVLLEGGFDAGFRTGMICLITSTEESVGEVMLVGVRKNCAAAVILNLESGQVIEPGHSVRVKTVKF